MSGCQRFLHGVHQSHGQQMLEFALILPLVLLIVMGIFAFGFIFNAQVTLANAAAAGARVGSVVNYAEYPVNGHQNTEIYQAIVQNMSWLGMGQVQSITIYQPNTDGTISGIKDQINPANGALISGNFTNYLRQSNTGLGVEIVYAQPVIVPVWYPVPTGDGFVFKSSDTIQLRVRESRRIE